MQAFGKVLKDTQINGKKQPFKELKDRGIHIAQALYRDESGSPTYNKRQRKASRDILNCANEIKYRVDKNTGEKRITDTYFCHNALCPLCEVKRYNSDSARLYNIIEYINESTAIQYKANYMLATLTIKNVDESHIRHAIEQLNYAWNKAKNYKAIKPYIRGTVKRIEVKVNKQDGTFNVHIHMLMLVKSSFYNGKNRLTHSQWSKYWTRAVNQGYKADIDVARLKTLDDTLRAMHYMVKVNEDIAEIDSNASDETIGNIISAENGKYRKHLLTLTGVLKDIDKAINKRYKRDYKANNNTGKHAEYKRSKAFNYINSEIEVYRYDKHSNKQDYYLKE